MRAFVFFLFIFDVVWSDCSRCVNGVRKCSLPIKPIRVSCAAYTLDVSFLEYPSIAKLSCRLGAQIVKFSDGCEVICSSGYLCSLPNRVPPVVVNSTDVDLALGNYSNFTITTSSVRSTHKLTTTSTTPSTQHSQYQSALRQPLSTQLPNLDSDRLSSASITLIITVVGSLAILLIFAGLLASLKTTLRRWGHIFLSNRSILNSTGSSDTSSMTTTPESDHIGTPIKRFGDTSKTVRNPLRRVEPPSIPSTFTQKDASCIFTLKTPKDQFSTFRGGTPKTSRTDGNQFARYDGLLPPRSFVLPRQNPFAQPSGVQLNLRLSQTELIDRPVSSVDESSENLPGGRSAHADMSFGGVDHSASPKATEESNSVPFGGESRSKTVEVNRSPNRQSPGSSGTRDAEDVEVGRNPIASIPSENAQLINSTANQAGVTQQGVLPLNSQDSTANPFVKRPQIPRSPTDQNYVGSIADHVKLNRRK